MRSATAALGLVLLAGCATELGLPHPTIDLPQSAASLQLAVGAEVPRLLAATSRRDGVFQPATGDEPPAAILQWQAFLKAGFDAGLSGFFAPASPARGADQILLLQEASLSSTWNRSGPIFSIRFRARLLDRTGAILRRSFGTVSSLAGQTPARAMDLMYEAIARDLLSAPSVADGRP